jgi:hypothetical protein
MPGQEAAKGRKAELNEVFKMILPKMILSKLFLRAPLLSSRLCVSIIQSSAFPEITAKALWSWMLS